MQGGGRLFGMGGGGGGGGGGGLMGMVSSLEQVSSSSQQQQQQQQQPPYGYGQPYPQPGYPSQYPPGGYAPQGGYPGYPPPGPQQGYPGYPPQGAPQGYPPAGAPQGYPPPGPQQGYPPPGAPQGYPPQQGYPAPQTYPPPPTQGPTIVQQPGAQHITDPLFRSKLENIHTYTVEQGNALLETLTLGTLANTYIVGDASRKVQVHGAPAGTVAPTPVFIVREVGSSCCCRFLCEGNQPFKALVYHAKETVSKGQSICGFYLGHKYMMDESVGPVMTLERQGCCSKCLGCCICSGKCENDMYMHLGESPAALGETKPDSSFFGRSVLSTNTPCFKPTMELYEGASKSTSFASSEGPCCCFGGWKGQCCGDNFKLSKQRGGAGDVGKVEKLRARGCGDICTQSVSNVDRYQLSFTDADKVTAEQRAIALAHTIHLDYIFFENDAPLCLIFPVDFETLRCQCSLCTFFLKGCFLPCTCTCDCKANGDN